MYFISKKLCFSWFFLVSLCLKANVEMVPKIPSCHSMLLMWPSRSKLVAIVYM
jgi:hypothetical protein